MTCLVALSNPTVNNGGIVTCVISIPDNYTFGQEDVRLEGASAPMKAFKELCGKYIEKHASGYHPAYHLLKQEHVDTTAVVAISFLDG